jgi:hypothetical protein
MRLYTSRILAWRLKYTTPPKYYYNTTFVYTIIDFLISVSHQRRFLAIRREEAFRRWNTVAVCSPNISKGFYNSFRAMSHRKSIYKTQQPSKGWNFVHITHQARIAMLYLYVANRQIETRTKDALSHKISIYQKCHCFQTNDGH